MLSQVIYINSRSTLLSLGYRYFPWKTDFPSKHEEVRSKTCRFMFCCPVSSGQTFKMLVPIALFSFKEGFDHLDHGSIETFSLTIRLWVPWGGTRFADLQESTKFFN